MKEIEVGQRVELNGKALTVVGVTRDPFGDTLSLEREDGVVSHNVPAKDVKRATRDSPGQKGG